MNQNNKTRVIVGPSSIDLENYIDINIGTIEIYFCKKLECYERTKGTKYLEYDNKSIYKNKIKKIDSNFQPLIKILLNLW